MTKTNIIKKYRNEPGCWYLDVLCTDNTWVSGNIMKPFEKGFGGFHTYDECQDLLGKFTDLDVFKENDVKEVVLFYSPYYAFENIEISREVFQR